MPIPRPFSSSSTSKAPVGLNLPFPTPTDNKVRIVEVSPRDGLQNEKSLVPTDIKCELIDRLRETGVKNIEVTSFVSPKWVPQMSDAGAIMSHVRGFQSGSEDRGIEYSVLAPNQKGLDAALASGVKEIAIFGSASEGFSKQNINCTIDESLQRFRGMCEKALKQGVRVRGYISNMCACPIDGLVDPKSVVRMTKEMLEMGCYEVSVADTTGVATPDQVHRTLSAILDAGVPANKLAAHFHDTYGTAVPNVLVALSLGIRTFDSSVSGLGGCPYAKGAKGNVATEDVLYLLHGMGWETGIDLQKMSEIGTWVSEKLGRENGSRAGKALKEKREAKL
ncbi:hypothetical protein SAICODRAFT_36319 [Saitoella complicata NRRL Y-17804]|uniref:uncharacterized protein n=1 Tax=Saitoella complicata (strain BCRC 22490 / CBS 7301 / JCM 7358 / NBRC 10748 / NRRL Y-17804) TaxID=698492 RepID=UPI000867EBD5|nr:uncharacterized protein SAICODRAFT_36319 [Saitoella complicata NRRL Y-17804]ODQ51595.1 hypothetical protein SAICODRAFT_36319 [Saitoella complicata NRRL Y-17804]